MAVPRFLQAWRWLFRSHRQAARAAVRAAANQRDIQKKQVIMMQLTDTLRSSRRNAKPGGWNLPP
jgi:hypothetical protein